VKISIIPKISLRLAPVSHGLSPSFIQKSDERTLAEGLPMKASQFAQVLAVNFVGKTPEEVGKSSG
jgi:hypothetical protein